jgi:SAM-dependent MidA family methyltransferase
LLDAMPVHRLAWDANAKTWFEWGVVLNAEKFAWARMQTAMPWLNDSMFQRINSSTIPRFNAPALEGLTSVLPDGFVMDISPAAELWWQNAVNSLIRGKLLTLDYGLRFEEFLQPERTDGTLRGYYQHRMITDVLANPGEQDLTAHVNFSAIQSAGEGAGLRTERFVSQEQFLTEIVARTSKNDSTTIALSSAQKRQFQTLTHPNFMGRQFSVFVQSR